MLAVHASGFRSAVHGRTAASVVMDIATRCAVVVLATRKDATDALELIIGESPTIENLLLECRSIHQRMPLVGGAYMKQRHHWFIIPLEVLSVQSNDLDGMRTMLIAARVPSYLWSRVAVCYDHLCKCSCPSADSLDPWAARHGTLFEGQVTSLLERVCYFEISGTTYELNRYHS